MQPEEGDFESDAYLARRQLGKKGVQPEEGGEDAGAGKCHLCRQPQLARIGGSRRHKEPEEAIGEEDQRRQVIGPRGWPRANLQLRRRGNTGSGAMATERAGTTCAEVVDDLLPVGGGWRASRRQ